MMLSTRTTHEPHQRGIIPTGAHTPCTAHNTTLCTLTTLCSRPLTIGPACDHARRTQQHNFSLLSFTFSPLSGTFRKTSEKNLLPLSEPFFQPNLFGGFFFKPFTHKHTHTHARSHSFLSFCSHYFVTILSHKHTTPAVRTVSLYRTHTAVTHHRACGCLGDYFTVYNIGEHTINTIVICVYNSAKLTSRPGNSFFFNYLVYTDFSCSSFRTRFGTRKRYYRMEACIRKRFFTQPAKFG